MLEFVSIIRREWAHREPNFSICRKVNKMQRCYRVNSLGRSFHGDHAEVWWQRESGNHLQCSARSCFHNNLNFQDNSIYPAGRKHIFGPERGSFHFRRRNESIIWIRRPSPIISGSFASSYAWANSLEATRNADIGDNLLAYVTMIYPTSVDDSKSSDMYIISRIKPESSWKKTRLFPSEVVETACFSGGVGLDGWREVITVPFKNNSWSSSMKLIHIQRCKYLYNGFKFDDWTEAVVVHSKRLVEDTAWKEYNYREVTTWLVLMI